MAEFHKPAKEKLGKQVMHICCNPDCEICTVGPNDDPEKVFTNIGSAAHIVTDKPGGPRYDKNFPPDKINQPENGIWLCDSCHSTIDRNGSGYSADELRSWKHRMIGKVYEQFGNQFPFTRVEKYYQCPRCREYTKDPEQLVCHQCSAKITYGARAADFKDMEQNMLFMFIGTLIAVMFLHVKFIAPAFDLNIISPVTFIFLFIAALPTFFYGYREGQKIRDAKRDQVWFEWKD